MDRGKVPHCPGTGTKFKVPAKAILDTNGIFLTEAQTKLLLNGFEGSGRKMMDWLEDTILDFTSDKSEFDQLLEARTGT